jgi:hypothetical protein
MLSSARRMESSLKEPQYNPAFCMFGPLTDQREKPRYGVPEDLIYDTLYWFI